MREVRRSEIESQCLMSQGPSSTMNKKSWFVSFLPVGAPGLLGDSTGNSADSNLVKSIETDKSVSGVSRLKKLGVSFDMGGVGKSYGAERRTGSEGVIGEGAVDAGENGGEIGVMGDKTEDTGDTLEPEENGLLVRSCWDVCDVDEVSVLGLKLDGVLILKAASPFAALIDCTEGGVKEGLDCCP